MEPVATRPKVPSAYGVPDEGGELLSWSHVEERMGAAMHYWLSTVGPDGAPHTRPVGGMWLENKLYFGGSPDSRWCRNLEANPRACINLSEDGDRAVILHGSVESVRPNRALAVRLVELSNEKYDYGQKPEEYEGQPVLVFAPELVFAWNAINRDPTRWELSG